MQGNWAWEMAGTVEYQLKVIPSQIHSETFHHRNEIPELKNLNGGMVYFDLQFQRFSTIIWWPFALGPFGKALSTSE